MPAALEAAHGKKRQSVQKDGTDGRKGNGADQHRLEHRLPKLSEIQAHEQGRKNDMACFAISAQKPYYGLPGQGGDDGESRGVADGGAKGSRNEVSGKQVGNDNRQNEMKAEERCPGQGDAAGKANRDGMGRRAQPQQPHSKIAE